MRYHKLLAAMLAVAAVAVGSVGRAGADEPDPPTGTVRQPLVAGTPVNVEEQEILGLVTVGGCSGVLLANDWVMTAGHCISTVRPKPPAETVTMNRADGTTAMRTSDAAYQFGVFQPTVGHQRNSPDLALVHLAQPFEIGGSTGGFANRLYGGSAASLKDKTLASYGRGFNTLATPATPASAGMPATPATGPQGAGVWRAGDLVVSSVDANGRTHTFLPNPQGRITIYGDSGGPSFIWESGVPYIAGIQSTAVPICTNPMTTATCQQTTTSISAATQVSIPAVRDWIAAVFETQWHPTATSEPILVRAAELAGTGWGFADANQASWAQAARAAAAMCYNRGFVGGHFDGHQDVAAGRFGIHCSGTGAVFYDITRADMDSRWAFADVNAVPWAQANRVAERYCATRGQGYAGGHFTGHMANGNYGLYCYKDNAQWFDATTAELAATRWTFATPRLDDVPWAQAARAAVDFCRARGFGGGFLNGHFVTNPSGPGNRQGVVCQK